MDNDEMEPQPPTMTEMPVSEPDAEVREDMPQPPKRRLSAKGIAAAVVLVLLVAVVLGVLENIKAVLS